ncbi:hypothetical protein PC120_g17364 [Phytophthora cactorum]|nr:hypothetical protein PC120_g17364 [Phytophthora cactorum]
MTTRVEMVGMMDATGCTSVVNTKDEVTPSVGSQVEVRTGDIAEPSGVDFAGLDSEGSQRQRWRNRDRYKEADLCGARAAAGKRLSKSGDDLQWRLGNEELHAGSGV